MLEFIRKTFGQKQARRTLLLTYMMILIPCVMIVIFCVSCVQDFAYSKLSTSILDSINMSSSTINSQIGAIEQLTHTLAADEVLSDYLSEPFHHLTANTVRKHLTQYISTTPLIDNLLVMGEGHPFICGAKGIFMKENSVLGTYLDGEPLCRIFEYRLDSLKPFHQKTYSVLDPTEVLVCTRRIYLEPVNRMSTVIVILDKQQLRSQLGVEAETGEGYMDHVALYTADGQKVTQLTANESISLDLELPKELDLREGGFFETRNGGEKVLVICDTLSSSAGYHMVAVIPHSRLQEGMTAAVQLVLIGSILLILFLGLCIFGVVYHTYNPIHELMEVSQKALNRLEEKKSINDMTQIKDIITNMTNRVCLLQTRLENMRHLEKHHLVSQLMNPVASDKTEQLLQKAGIHFDQPFFSVVVCQFSTGDDQNAFHEFLSDYPHPQMNLLFTPVISPKSSIIIVCNHCLQQQELRRFWSDCAQHWREQSRAILCMGLSSIHDSVETIGASYIEAENALDYRFIFGESLIAYWEIQKQDSLPCDSIRSLNSFGNIYQAIINTDTAKIHAILDQLSSYMLESHLPLSFIKGLCYELISNVVEAINELTARDILAENSIDVIQLGQFETVGQLLEMIAAIAQSLEKLLDNPLSDKDERSIDAVLRYCQQHYADPDFSLQNTAEAFNMSLSSFSQFFKQKAGTPPINYIAELRIGYAKRLLKETDLSIADVCSQVGYFSTSSFIRKFRQQENCTPTEYRTRMMLQRKYGGVDG